MFIAIAIVHVLVCAFLILVVLLQSGKGGGLGAGLGGASQTVFGGAGAGNFLTRLTAIGAGVFMLTSITLAYISSSASGERSLRERAAQSAERTKALKVAASKRPAKQAPMSGDEDAGAAIEDDDEEPTLDTGDGGAAAEPEATGDAAAAPAAEGDDAPAAADAPPADAPAEPAAADAPAPDAPAAADPAPTAAPSQDDDEPSADPAPAPVAPRPPTKRIAPRRPPAAGGAGPTGAVGPESP